MNDISHFAIRADNLQRAKQFYSGVFGWKFEPWGPPDFYLIHTSDNPGRTLGALQLRELPLKNEGICAFECTIAVNDVDRIADAVKAQGGMIVYEKSTIHGVGEILRVRDTEGNFLCAMKYFGVVSI